MRSAVGAAMLVGALLVGAGSASAQARPATPPQAAPSRAFDVSIRRDLYGVPHVLGRTDADAAFGLAFAHAEDDFATFQEAVFTSRGKLASLKGASGVNSDWMYALMDIDRVVAERYETDLPPEVRRIVEAYAAGINRYAATRPETVKPGLLPVTGKDIVGGTIFRGPIFAGLDDVFEQVMTGKVPPEKQTGSNAVAVAPRRSADGATRLLYNAHQPFTGPYAWYEAVVESGEGWHVAGGFFPGAPFLLGGHNENLGFAATVNRPDLADIYRLTINPADLDQYRLDGRWERFDKRFVDISVAGIAGGPVTTVQKEVLRSRHGPAVRSAAGVFAVRYPTRGGALQLHQNYRMNKARTLAEFQAAMAMQALPSINYLYADDKGNIGFVHNGLYPERTDGPDWKGVVDGTRSDLIWTRTRPFAQTPQIWNPRSGWLFNANNDPFFATDPADDLKRAAYPASMGIQTDMTNRAYRALEVYGADTSITAAEWDAYKYDLAYSSRSETMALVKGVLAMDAGADADLAAAQAVLRKWDGKTDVKNRGAALPAVSWLLARQPGTTPPQAFRQAMALLKATYGRLDPEWGEVNRIRRGSVDLPLDGGPDIFRAIYGRPDKDGRLRAFIGDTYVMFIEWDRAGKLSSRSVHQFGSATLDATSPHYADQVQLFANRKTKPVLFTEAQLRGQVEREYRPGEATR